jgi:hypothetical protein
MRNADFVCLSCRLRRFGANLLKLSKLRLQVKRRITSNLNRKPGSHPRNSILGTTRIEKRLARREAPEARHTGR